MSSTLNECLGDKNLPVTEASVGALAKGTATIIDQAPRDTPVRTKMTINKPILVFLNTLSCRTIA